MPKFLTFLDLSDPCSRRFVNTIFSKFKVEGFML